MIKTLLKSVREYKMPAILTSVFVAFEVVMEILIPYFMAELIDKGIYTSNMNSIVKYGLFLLFFAIISLVFGVINGRLASIASCGFAKNLRKDIFYKIQEFSFSNIDKFSAPSLVTRLTTDINSVQRSFQMMTRIAVRTPLMLLFSLFMAFRINAKLSLIFLFLIPFVGFSLYFIAKKVYPIFIRLFKTYDELNEVVEENVSGIRVVKSYVLEDKEIKKFNKVSNKIYTDYKRSEELISLSNPLMQLASYAAMLLISWIGARIIVTSGATLLTTGKLTSLITYAMQILMSLMMLTMTLVMITMSRASMKRIVEVLEEKVDITTKENPVTKVRTGDIEFRNVSFSYVNKKDKECLKNINLKIHSGQTIGIIGGIGTGKSTLVNLIPRLYDATEGEVLVGGVNVKDYDLKALRDSVACVLQKNILFTGTIADNLRWGKKDASGEEIKEAAHLAVADEFVEKLDKKYDTKIERGGSNVSGGQKQRLTIARALLKKPKILILDDSTSAVDTKTDALIRSAFKKYIPDTTKIIIAQRISSVEEADKILVLDEKGISGFGTHKELLKTNKIYKEVYDSQTKGGGVLDEK